MKKRICLLILAIILTLQFNAQNWLCYGYDTSGNRIYRIAATIRANEMTRSVNDSLSLLPGVNNNIQLSQTVSKLKVEIENWEKTAQAFITIYDLLGREMYSESVISEVTFIDISKLNRGTYILSVCLNGDLTNRKFKK